MSEILKIKNPLFGATTEYYFHNRFIKESLFILESGKGFNLRWYQPTKAEDSMVTSRDELMVNFMPMWLQVGDRFLYDASKCDNTSFNYSEPYEVTKMAVSKMLGNIVVSVHSTGETSGAVAYNFLDYMKNNIKLLPNG